MKQNPDSLILTSAQLKKCTDPNTLPKTSNQADPLEVSFGQPRAIKAIETALGIDANGYHVFAAGENGLGKRTLITRLLAEHAKSLPTPNDWVYVYNYNNPREPIAIQLPAGQGRQLAEAIEQVWSASYKRLHQRFRSDWYQSQVETIKNDIHAKETEAYEQLSEEGKQYNLELHFRSSDNKAVFVESQSTSSIRDDSDTHAQLQFTDDLVTDANAKTPTKTNAHLINPVNGNTHSTLNHTSTVNKDGNHCHDQAEDTSNTQLDSNLNNPVDKQSEQKIENKPDNKDHININSKVDSNVDNKIDSHEQKNHMLKRFNQLTIQLEQLEDQANSAIKTLHTNIAKRALEPIFEPVIQRFGFGKGGRVKSYLQDTLADMIRHVERIVNQDDDEFVVGNLSNVPIRYCVNVMVSHQPDSGAPIIFEDLPTHLNLLGHVEQVTHLGTVTTDVSMIRAGSLHRANGGYLLLEANSLLEHPYAWQGLKRALQSKQIKLSSLEQMMTLTGSLSLAPSSIELAVKVILLGEADLYYELIDFEPEFDAVFKIRADFHDDVERNATSERAMVAKMADIIKTKELMSFNRLAQATIIDHLSLLADDQNRLSLHSDELSKLLFESDRHARIAKAKQVSKIHVQRTISDMQQRSGYLRDLYWQEIENGQQIIHTRGEAVGQMNALTVISYADSEFGLPARLTALIQPKSGRGDILDIERDVNLGGNLHAKGMLIMTSYLQSLFSRYHDLNFSASLAFEQNYAHIDGDSATLAEACALISALAQVPIKQSIAITGSMNQLGEVQAVGGLNAKITGFFDACVEQGLTGEQGVIMPKSNVHNLMLGDAILEAVANRQFTIYAIDHLHQALQLLTGIAVDKKTKKGNFRKNTLFGKIVKRLKDWEDDE